MKLKTLKDVYETYLNLHLEESEREKVKVVLGAIPNTENFSDEFLIGISKLQELYDAETLFGDERTGEKFTSRHVQSNPGFRLGYLGTEERGAMLKEVMQVHDGTSRITFWSYGLPRDEARAVLIPSIPYVERKHFGIEIGRLVQSVTLDDALASLDAVFHSSQ